MARTLLTFCLSVFLTGCVKSEEKKELAYIQSGQEESDYRILFIHGSPGSKEGYQAYLDHPELAQRAELISADRLGYGANPRIPEPSIMQQAVALQPFLSDSKKNILVGHSLGSPIALQLALLEPKNVEGMVLVASAFDPELEHPKWYNLLADTIVVKWLLSKDMNNSNEEMMVLSQELTELSSQDWSQLTMPIDIVHGDEDELADPDNAEYVYNKLSKQDATLTILRQKGHFVLWKDHELIVRQIVKLLDRVEQGRQK